MRLIQSNHTSLVLGWIHLTSVALAVELGSQPSLFSFNWLQFIIRFDPDLLESSLSHLMALNVVMLSGFASSPNRTNSPLVGPVAQTGHTAPPALRLSLPTHQHVRSWLRPNGLWRILSKVHQKNQDICIEFQPQNISPVMTSLLSSKSA